MIAQKVKNQYNEVINKLIWSVKMRLSKQEILFAKDFEDKEVTFKEKTLNSKADFYSVSTTDKKSLLDLQNRLDVLNNDLAKGLAVSEFTKKLDSLTQSMAKLGKHFVLATSKSGMKVGIKADLLPEYQSVKQLGLGNKNMVLPAIVALYAIEWEESERGWGCRPDGFSFHRSEQEANQYVKDFQARLPKEVPDEYSRPCGKPKLLEVSESLYKHVMKNGSVWLNPNHASAYKTYDASHLGKKVKPQ